MEVVVADDQLSLAIGKKGQNVRLAAKLTGWKIDVRSESKEEKISGESFEQLLAIDAMDEETATMLFDNGYGIPEDIAKATLAELTSFMGITEEKGVACCTVHCDIWLILRKRKRNFLRNKKRCLKKNRPKISQRCRRRVLKTLKRFHDGRSWYEERPCSDKAMHWMP